MARKSAVYITTYMGEAERQQVVDAANEADMSVSKFARQALARAVSSGLNFCLSADEIRLRDHGNRGSSSPASPTPEPEPLKQEPSSGPVIVVERFVSLEEALAQPAPPEKRQKAKRTRKRAKQAAPEPPAVN